MPLGAMAAQIPIKTILRPTRPRWTALRADKKREAGGRPCGTWVGPSRPGGDRQGRVSTP